MNRVGKFEKVSFEQFYEAVKNSVNVSNPDEITEEQIKEIYDAIQLPVRATAGSAGYDFRIPFGVRLPPEASFKIPTGIRVKIEEGWWLGCLPRSGLGFKYRMQLDNTMGVIDSDYYYSDNEGHIFARITNDTNEDKALELKLGDAFMQGIFLPYGITYNDNADGVRNGGLGSTSK